MTKREQVEQTATQEALDSLKLVLPYEQVAKGKLVKLKFDKTVDEYAEVADKIKNLEARKKELAGEILLGLGAAGVTKVTCNGFTVTQAEGRSGSKLDAKKLLELGVKAETIAKATVAGGTYVYALVTAIKEKD